MKNTVFKLVWLVLCIFSLNGSAAQLGLLTYEVTTDGIVITDCDQSATEVEIPDKIGVVPVTSIGEAAFNGCRSIESIILPSSLRSIGRAAFGGCSSLSSITIPEGVTSIEPLTFVSCGKLTSVSLPDSLLAVKSDAFVNSGITSIVIPEQVTLIGGGAFVGCSALVSVVIPDSVTSIGLLTEVTEIYFRPLFKDTTALERLVIPKPFHSRSKAHEIGAEGIYPWGFYLPSSNQSNTKPSIRMAPVIMVQGDEGSVKTIEVADSPDGPWRFWMTVTATESGVAITDLDGDASKRFYKVTD